MSTNTQKVDRKSLFKGQVIKAMSTAFLTSSLVT